MEGTAFKRVGLMLMVLVLLSATEVQADFACDFKCKLKCLLVRKLRSVCVDNCLKKCEKPPRTKDLHDSTVHLRGIQKLEHWYVIVNTFKLLHIHIPHLAFKML